MNRLLDVGFQAAGHWISVEGKLQLELTRHSTQKNILYAFVRDGEVMYVGKTLQTLAIRMSGYRSPVKTQSTNVNNNRRILDVLARGSSIEILALPDSGLLHYGKFHINLAAALEDDIIRKLDPPWNGGRPEKPSDTEADVNRLANEPAKIFVETFHFILQPTYFQRGFFNVGVSAHKHIGSDGEIIELFLGVAPQPVLGTINRRVNTNGTPRVMGGTALRDWFQHQGHEADCVSVQVFSPASIRLAIAGPKRENFPDQSAIRTH